MQCWLWFPAHPGQDIWVVLSDQWFPLKLTTHQPLPHFTIEQYHPPTPPALWGQTQIRAKLTNQKIAPDPFPKLKKLQAASSLPLGPRLHIKRFCAGRCLPLSLPPAQCQPLPRSLFDVFSFSLNCSACTLGVMNVLLCSVLSAWTLWRTSYITKPREIQKELSDPGCMGRFIYLFFFKTLILVRFQKAISQGL